MMAHSGETTTSKPVCPSNQYGKHGHLMPAYLNQCIERKELLT
jgi:hypothetical protein